MKKTIDVVKALRLKGAPVSASVITSVAVGIINATDRSILVENGGYLTLNNQWGRNVLYRMERDEKGWSNRLGTTCKVPVSPGTSTL